MTGYRSRSSALQGSGHTVGVHYSSYENLWADLRRYPGHTNYLKAMATQVQFSVLQNEGCTNLSHVWSPLEV